jgi:membrane protease YdiL (CAAX protease family)
MLDERSTPRGRPILAWAVIGAVACWMAWRQAAEAPQRRAADLAPLSSALGDFQSRYLVGAASLFGGQERQLLQQAEALDRGPAAERLRYVVLTGEFAGPKEALRRIDALVGQQEAAADNDEQALAQTVELMRRLYDDLAAEKLDAPSLVPADRERLTTRLGWLGRLVLHPAGGPDKQGREELIASARGTMIVTLVAVAAFFMAGLVGFAGLVGLVVLLLLRKQSRALVMRTGQGGIYAETFALWMLVYIGLSYAVAMLPIERNRLLFLGGAMLASLAVLAWPVVRGVPWRQVREDIGLHLGRRPWLEPFAGAGCYLTALPLLLAGVLVMLVLMAVERALRGDAGAAGLTPDSMPSHPIVHWVVNAPWWGRVQVLIVAAVVAPIVEETMFRGVLHRHLRDATWRLGYVASVVASATVASFVFAAIHPQGWLGVPPLMALALAFTLTREWRGTLVPSMVAHGINNAVATWVLIWLVG